MSVHILKKGLCLAVVMAFNLGSPAALSEDSMHQEKLPSNLIVMRDGMALDHVALVTPDLDASLDMIEQTLGVRPLDLGVFGSQRRAAGRIGTESFLEIIGPAENSAGTQDPVIQVALELSTPSLLFWYAAVSDFDRYAAHATAAKLPLQMIQHIQSNDYEYTIGGPEGIIHTPVVPWFIEWTKPSPALDWPTLGKLLEFRLEHPKPAQAQSKLDALKVPAKVYPGAAPRLRLRLQGPAGELAL